MGHFLVPGVAGQAVAAVSGANLYQKGEARRESPGLKLQGSGHSRIYNPHSVSMEPPVK